MEYKDALKDAFTFTDAHEKPHMSVPIVRATPESVIGYGTLVADFHAEDIIRVTWPKSSGWWPVFPGTGHLQVNTGNVGLSTDADVSVFCLCLFMGVYPYLPLATNAPWTIWGEFIKSLTNFSIQKSI